MFKNHEGAHFLNRIYNAENCKEIVMLLHFNNVPSDTIKIHQNIYAKNFVLLYKLGLEYVIYK